jgi:hypothetical protein
MEFNIELLTEFKLFHLLEILVTKLFKKHLCIYHNKVYIQLIFVSYNDLGINL